VTRQLSVARTATFRDAARQRLMSTAITFAASQDRLIMPDGCPDLPIAPCRACSGPTDRSPVTRQASHALVCTTWPCIHFFDALAWQVITWRQSGAIVTVAAFQAFPADGDRAGEPHLNVTARITGRSPVTVNGWGLRLPDGRTMVVPSPAPWSSQLETGQRHRLLRRLRDCRARGTRRSPLLIVWPEPSVLTEPSARGACRGAPLVVSVA
jgi:hypothetical protein